MIEASHYCRVLSTKQHLTFTVVSLMRSILPLYWKENISKPTFPGINSGYDHDVRLIEQA